MSNNKGHCNNEDAVTRTLQQQGRRDKDVITTYVVTRTTYIS